LQERDGEVELLQQDAQKHNALREVQIFRSLSEEDMGYVVVALLYEERWIK
jgi:hypothetical protein